VKIQKKMRSELVTEREKEGKGMIWALSTNDECLIEFDLVVKATINKIPPLVISPKGLFLIESLQEARLFSGPESCGFNQSYLIATCREFTALIALYDHTTSRFDSNYSCSYPTKSG
jgi:hypothetical protein